MTDGALADRLGLSCCLGRQGRAWDPIFCHLSKPRWSFFFGSSWLLKRVDTASTGEPMVLPHTTLYPRRRQISIYTSATCHPRTTSFQSKNLIRVHPRVMHETMARLKERTKHHAGARGDLEQVLRARHVFLVEHVQTRQLRRDGIPVFQQASDQFEVLVGNDLCGSVGDAVRKGQALEEEQLQIRGEPVADQLWEMGRFGTDVCRHSFVLMRS